MTLRDDIERLGLHRGSFSSPNGHLWTWVFNFREVFLDRPTLILLARTFWKHAAPAVNFQLGAVETAAVPLLIAIGLYSPRQINLFTVRKEPKSYGLQEDVEGKLTSEPILMLDDIFNSGKSMERARSVLAARRRRIDGIFVVIDFRTSQGTAWRADYRIPIESMFTLADFDLTLGSGAGSCGGMRARPLGRAPMGTTEAHGLGQL